MRVLITDLESRKGFDVFNIVRRDLSYDVVATAPRHTSVRLPMIYGQRIHELADRDYLSFERDLLKIMKCYDDLIYIPVSEKYTLFLYDFVKRNPQENIKFLLPDKNEFILSREKDLFQSYCESFGFPVPKSFQKEDLKVLRRNFTPIVLKKKIGAGSVGMKFISKREDISVLDSLNMDEYLIQEFIKSDCGIYGGFYLCRKGEVVSFHGHSRLRTFPESGGVTIFSKAQLNTDIERIGREVLKALNWDGLAMIEFMLDNKTGSWKIIELNPRLWGSVLLTHFSGSGLIENYIRLVNGDDLHVDSFQEESYIHWLYPFDIMNFLKGKLPARDLFNWGRRVCYVNFTYSTFWSTIAYLMYFTFNVKSIKRMLTKLRR